MHEVLLDTGAFVALIDRSELNHMACRGVLKAVSGRLVTTEPVLAETLLLLGPSFAAQKPVMEFVLRGGVEVVSQNRHSLERAMQLMEKYRDLPMSYTDATLVALAVERKISKIFTLERKRFSIYRTHSQKTFTIYPLLFDHSSPSNLSMTLPLIG